MRPVHTGKTAKATVSPTTSSRPRRDSDDGSLDENHYSDARTVAEVAPQVTSEIVRPRARCPSAYFAEEVSPQVEDIDFRQPEAIVTGARHQAPGEACKNCPVDRIRPAHRQNSDDSQQRQEEPLADDAQRDDPEHLSRHGQQGGASEDQVQAEANWMRYPDSDSGQQLLDKRPVPGSLLGFHRVAPIPVQINWDRVPGQMT